MEERHIKKVLASNIKYYRLTKGYSLEEFAKKLGVDVKFCEDIENMKRDISVVELVQIADVLVVEIDKLFVEKKSEV